MALLSIRVLSWLVSVSINAAAQPFTSKKTSSAMAFSNCTTDSAVVRAISRSILMRWKTRSLRQMHPIDCA